MVQHRKTRLDSLKCVCTVVVHQVVWIWLVTIFLFCWNRNEISAISNIFNFSGCERGPEKVQVKVKGIVFDHCSELPTHTISLLFIMDLARVSCWKFHRRSERDLQRYVLHLLSTPSLAGFTYLVLKEVPNMEVLWLFQCLTDLTIRKVFLDCSFPATLWNTLNIFCDSFIFLQIHSSWPPTFLKYDTWCCSTKYIGKTVA